MTKPVGRPKAYLDFEYSRSKEERLNLVAACLKAEPVPDVAPEVTLNLWLDGHGANRLHLKNFLLSIRDTHTLVAFNVVAEASSLIALNLDPTKFQWIDLQLEYKMLLNHNHKYMYGDQLVAGKKKKTKPPKPKWERTAEDVAGNAKPESNLAATLYKMLGVLIDTEHKTAMRDLIISQPAKWQDEDREAVMKYCASDVEHLPALHKCIIAAYKETQAYRRGDIQLTDLLWRGETAARTALMMCLGYPVNALRVKSFSAAVPSILKDIADDINTQFPEKKVFEWNKKSLTFTMKQEPQREFVRSCPFADKWQRTDKKDISLALEAWTQHYNYSHEYPQGNFPAQIIRYLKTKQNLNGFLPKSKTSDKKTFFDSYGSDGRARAWLNPYGSQSSRFQPSATGFIPLKSAWMRSLIEPRPGFSIASIDYGSEEFLLAALLSGDEKMYQAYASGDPYLAFAKEAKAVPAHGTKETHATERNRFKSTVLGVGYLMGNFSLSAKLTQDTGVHHTPEQAQKLIDLYFEVFSGYSKWIDKTINDYSQNGYLRLLDGWIMFGDNPNFRSVSNCPVQGTGAVILRRAIKIAQERGLRVIIPLHDALYIEYPTKHPEKIDILADAMREAFTWHFTSDPKIYAWSKAIRLDPDAWGRDHVDGEIITPAGMKVKTQKVYIDPRAKDEYERFSKYF